MPTFDFFDHDRDVKVSEHITVSEFISECNRREKAELIKCIFRGHGMSAGEEIFEEHLMALHNNWNRLSSEEEKTIIEIAKRFK